MDIAGTNWDVLLPGTAETVEGVESAELNLDQETVDIDGLNGVRYTRTRIRSANLVLTVFGTSIANLKKILPDNWLAAATQIAGQETGVIAKTGENGVITYGKPSCGTARILAPVQLVPCENPDDHTVTLFDGYAEITGFPMDDGVLKVEITIRSEAVGVMVAKGAVDGLEAES